MVRILLSFYRVTTLEKYFVLILKFLHLFTGWLMRFASSRNHQVYKQNKIKETADDFHVLDRSWSNIIFYGISSFSMWGNANEASKIFSKSNEIVVGTAASNSITISNSEKLSELITVVETTKKLLLCQLKSFAKFRSFNQCCHTFAAVAFRKILKK